MNYGNSCSSWGLLLADAPHCSAAVSNWQITDLSARNLWWRSWTTDSTWQMPVITLHVAHKQHMNHQAVVSLLIHLDLPTREFPQNDTIRKISVSAYEWLHL